MQFRSKPESYSYAILLLRDLAKAYPEAKEINMALENAKIAFENHEQNPKVICELVAGLQKLDYLNPKDVETIGNFIKSLQKQDYKQSAQEQFENPLGRRFESELFVLLLLQPTTSMLQVTGQMSAEILNAMKTMAGSYKLTSFLSGNLIEKFPTYSYSGYDPITFGAFSKAPSEDVVVKSLSDNNPKNFIQNVFIHCQFARYIYRDISITTAPARPPVGKLAEIIKRVWDGKPEEFFSQGLVGYDDRLRSHVGDRVISASDLYHAPGKRGRDGSLRHTRTKQMGLMLSEQKAFAESFPTLPCTWVPDCLGQAPNLDSAYVKDQIDNDTVYVSGPSGMTSCFLGQMETLGNLPTVAAKQHYLVVTVSYIVGGGFHSAHEVLGPAQYCLDLIPGYNVSVPKAGKAALPPNYHAFFDLIAKIDPEFNARRNQAWNNYLDFFAKVYLAARKLPKPVIHGPLASQRAAATTGDGNTNPAARVASVSIFKPDLERKTLNTDSQSIPQEMKNLLIAKIQEYIDKRTKKGFTLTLGLVDKDRSLQQQKFSLAQQLVILLNGKLSSAEFPKLIMGYRQTIEMLDLAAGRPKKEDGQEKGLMKNLGELLVLFNAEQQKLKLA
jgi:hypothetical protein